MTTYRKIILVALILAFGVVALGAYVRLSDAGLGCPDWPGCYGKLTPHNAVDAINAELAVRPDGPAVGPSREQIPLPPTPAGQVRLEGMAVDPHSRYIELMHAPSQGRVWQNLDFARYAATTRLALQPVLLLQTTPLADGLLRDWPRPDTGVSMHVSYAIQWYSLATTLAVLWLVLNVKRHRNDDD